MYFYIQSVVCIDCIYGTKTFRLKRVFKIFRQKRCHKKCIKIVTQKERPVLLLIERGVFVLCVMSLSDTTTMEEKDDQYLTDVLSYSAERLAKVRDYYVDYYYYATSRGGISLLRCFSTTTLRAFSNHHHLSILSLIGKHYINVFVPKRLTLKALCLLPFFSTTTKNTQQHNRNRSACAWNSRAWRRSKKRRR